MSNIVNYNNCSIGDKVCFKSEEEKEDYEACLDFTLSDCVYGIIIYKHEEDETHDLVRVKWLNHKGIVIESLSVCYSRLKFYNE